MGARLRDIAEGRRDALNVDPKLIRIEKGFNPRLYTLPENREHLDALKSSVREMGVKVPLLVRWDVGSEQAILIDGECRLRACLELIKGSAGKGGLGAGNSSREGGRGFRQREENGKPSA